MNTDDTAFCVHLRRQDTTIRVSAEESVLDALLGAGVRVNYMCRNGLCGTCQTRVLEGRIDHRDTFLTDDQHAHHRYMMLCVSRSAGNTDVVLDL